MPSNDSKRLLPFFFGALLVSACSDEGVMPTIDGPPRVALSLAAIADPSLLVDQRPTQLTLDDGTNTLVLSRVSLVLREIELKRLSVSDCDDVGPGDDDSCEEFSTGPILLDLDLGGAAAQVLSIEVELGIYDEVEFEVHKPEDESLEDLGFLQEHPEFRQVSIWVDGTYNGNEFTFLQDLNEEQELPLSPAMVVDAAGQQVNLTLSLDLGSWFRGVDGSLLDPRSANKGGDNEGLVEDNIKRSIDLFRDDDRDGRR